MTCAAALLPLIVCVNSVSSFTCETRNTHPRIRAVPTLSVAAAPERGEADLSESSKEPLSLSNAQTERFHQDMKRVLESRAKTSTVAEKAAQSILERRQRPEVLSDDKDGLQRVLTMLNRMIQMGFATEETFQIAMQACLGRGRLRWKNYGDAPGSSQVMCAADQMELLLQQLEGVTSSISLETYSLVLEAYATCSTPRGERKYAQKADALLMRMQQEGVFGTPNVEELTQDDKVPAHVLAHVLHAWAWQQANLQRENCSERAHEYLEQIENSREDVGASLLMQCYDWVLEAWSKSGSPSAANKADQVFQKLKNLNQTQSDDSIFSTQLYSNVILAWSKSTEPGSAERAHALLLEMIEKFKQGAFASSEPELIAFNGVVTAWAKMGNAEKAAEILSLMEDIQSKCQHLVPNALTYNTVLHAHVMSSNPTKALERIQRIVDYMEENCAEKPDITPDSFTYNTLMKVSGFLKGWYLENREPWTNRVYLPSSRHGFEAANLTRPRRQKRFFTGWKCFGKREMTSWSRRIDTSI